MSLWTPYVPERPLDLTKSAVKEERHSPTISPLAESVYPYQYMQDMSTQGYYPGYLPYSVPTAQMSPISGGSTCSSYEVSSSSPPFRPATLSPPESPSSKCLKSSAVVNYMADADVLSDDPDFQAFERDALRAMAERNGGSLLGNNPRMRRAVQGSAGDDAYRKQRERNNHAAKQSRDRRKLREIHLALKVAYLKNEVTKMKTLLSRAGCSQCQQRF